MHDLLALVIKEKIRCCYLLHYPLPFTSFPSLFLARISALPFSPIINSSSFPAIWTLNYLPTTYFILFYFYLGIIYLSHCHLFPASDYCQFIEIQLPISSGLATTVDNPQSPIPPPRLPSPPVREILNFETKAMAGLATSSQLYSNEPPNPLHMQYWQKGQLDQEDDSVLDDHILDSSSYDTAAMDNIPRRQSFASSASLLSPRQQTWPDFAYNNDATPNASLNHQAPLFPEHIANNFPSGIPHYPNYASHMAAWSSQGNVGSDTSNAAAFTAFNADLDDVKPEEPFNHDVAQPAQQNLYGGLPRHSAPEYRHDAASVASPQWSTSSSDAVEKIPRSGHVQSPTFNHNAPHLRRDGVRKKNARFDIPDGHNVHTIDLLIAAADPTNEEKIRTLKQEKRLLRNRQAAYDDPRTA